MDEELEKSLQGFDKLWERVIKKEEPEAFTAPVSARADRVLRRLMDAEAGEAADYERLAAQFSGPCRAVLLKILREEGGHLKKLQTEYFLHTGDSYTPNAAAKPSMEGAFTALRACWLREQQGAEDYLQAAKGDYNSGLKSLFGELASEETYHAAQLRRLIELNLA